MKSGRDKCAAGMRADIARTAGNQNHWVIAHARLTPRLIDVGGPAPAEQEIERARVGGEIAPEQPARLEPEAPGPFQPGILHPSRRTGTASRQVAEQSARGLDDADIAKPGQKFIDKGLLVGNAEPDPEVVRRKAVDLVDLGAQRVATQIAVGTPD